MYSWLAVKTKSQRRQRLGNTWCASKYKCHQHSNRHAYMQNNEKNTQKGHYKHSKGINQCIIWCEHNQRESRMYRDRRLFIGCLVKPDIIRIAANDNFITLAWNSITTEIEMHWYWNVELHPKLPQFDDKESEFLQKSVPDYSWKEFSIVIIFGTVSWMSVGYRNIALIHPWASK